MCYLDEYVWTKAEGFDVLSWWKLNSPKYPTLACMARDFLAIPASTVASESAFSSSGRLVSPHRKTSPCYNRSPNVCSKLAVGCKNER